MKILFIQHDPLDGPGALLDWASERRHSVATCLISEVSSKGQPLPALHSFDLLISLGGPMGAYEEEQHPWLIAEKAYLRKSVAAHKKILGLCLGAQLLADALGGKAFRHSLKEFGWQRIEPTEQGKEWFPLHEGECSFLASETHKKTFFKAFQWHGDTYSLPPGAVQIARNSACEQQAFLIRSEVDHKPQVIGLQFHLEWTEQMMRDALADPDVAPPASPTVQTPEEIMSDLTLFTSSRERFFALMDRFVG